MLFLKNRIKNFEICLSHFLAFCFIFFSSYNNIFPEGFFFASGDAYQVTNFPIWSKKFSFVIEDESLGLYNRYVSYLLYYYPFFWISNLLNLTTSEQSGLHQFFFLYFSYLSFYYFCKIGIKNINHYLSFILSICYAFNVIVFSFFWYTWAYTPITIIYVLLPIFFGLYINFLQEKNIRKKVYYILISSPIIFLLNIAFSNLAYFVFVFIFFNFFFFYYFFFDIKLNFKSIKKEFFFLIIFWIYLFLINSWSLTNYIFYIDYEKLMIESGWYTKLQWIKNQSLGFPKPFFLFENYESMEPTMGFFSKISVFLVMLLAMILVKKENVSKNILIFFSFLLIFFFIDTKGNGILNDDFIKKIFADSVLYAFRSWDKIHIFYPFLILGIFGFYFSKTRKSNYFFSILILIICLFSSYPLIIGGIKTKYDLSIPKNKDYLNAEFTMLKKSNDDILKISKLLNDRKDYDKYLVLNLPYTGINSPNWSNYQKSQHTGIDPYNQNFKHKIVSLNDSITVLLHYFRRDWNLSKDDYWPTLVGKIFSAKYIIFHKDIYDFLLAEGNLQIQKFNNIGALSKLYEGKTLDLYEIKSNYYQEIIYIPDIRLLADGHSNVKKTLEENFIILKDKKFYYEIGGEYPKKRELKQAAQWMFENDLITNPEISYKKRENEYIKILNLVKNEGGIFSRVKALNSKTELPKIKLSNLNKINPSLFKFTIKNNEIKNKNFNIIFSNLYNKFWKLKCTNCNDQSVVTRHFIANGIMNGWEISSDKDIMKFELEFVVQKYFNIFFLISIFISLFSIILCIIFKKRFFA